VGKGGSDEFTLRRVADLTDKEPSRVAGGPQTQDVQKEIEAAQATNSS